MFTFTLRSNLHLGFGNFFCLCKVVNLPNGQSTCISQYNCISTYLIAKCKGVP